MEIVMWVATGFLAAGFLGVGLYKLTRRSSAWPTRA